MIWPLVLLSFVVGLAIGSFMTVVVARLPEGESVVAPRSKCPRCGTQLRNRDNVPVLGWLMLKGRCRQCGEPISLMYPAVELSTAVLIAGAFAEYGDPARAVAVASLLALMPAIAVIDIQHRIIPNRIVYPALIAFPAYLLVANVLGADVDLARMAGGFFLYGGMLLVVALISGGMGMGDVKLAALIGLVLGSLGLRHVGVAAGAAIVLGGLGGLLALALGKGRKAKIPFGPYLAVGAVVAAFLTEPISGWYLEFIWG